MEAELSGRRWLKFWPQDWQRDPALRICSVAARGLWMDLICIAHEGKPYGHVTVNSIAATMRQIGRIAGTTEKEAVKLIQELEDAGVFSRTEDGLIFSRRMVRDHEASDAGREAIEKRWNMNKGIIVNPTVDPIRGADSLYSEAEAEAERKKDTPIPPFGVQPQAAPSALNGAKHALPKRARYVPGDAPAFDEFWRRYPRKIEGPVTAKKAWDKAIENGAEPNAIIGGVARYPFDAKDGGKYIPQATTWLNQSRWTTQADTLPLAPVGPRKTTPTYGGVY